MQEERRCNTLPIPRSIPGGSGGWRGGIWHLRSRHQLSQWDWRKTPASWVLGRVCVVRWATGGDGGRGQLELDEGWLYIIRHVSSLFQNFLRGACENEECEYGLCPLPFTRWHLQFSPVPSLLLNCLFFFFGVITDHKDKPFPMEVIFDVCPVYLELRSINLYLWKSQCNFGESWFCWCLSYQILPCDLWDAKKLSPSWVFSSHW